MKRTFNGRNKSVSATESLKMINFCKNATCPPSQKLLAFQKNESPHAETAPIRHHLMTCEFCAAEVEFYAHFPQGEDACAESKIPPALYELAEALLGGKQKDFALFNKLISEPERLTLEKA